MPNPVEQQPFNQNGSLRQNDADATRFISKVTSKNNLALTARSYSASIALPTDLAVAKNTGASVTFTLPRANSWGDNSTNLRSPILTIVNSHVSSFLTIATTGADVINGVTTISIPPQSCVELMVYDTNAWVTVGPQNTWATQSYTPTINGATSTGLGTYTNQQGFYIQSGRLVYFCINLTWTAHTGTGQAYIILPPVNAINTLLLPNHILSNGIALPAGSQLQTLSSSAANTFLYTSNAGVLAAFNLPAAGTIYFNGGYIIL